MQNIQIQNSSKSELLDFESKAWRGENLAHYGERVEWVTKQFAFKATLEEEIIGCATGVFESGVVELSTLIVDKNHRKKGIGKMLLNQVIEWAKPLGAHKIILSTMERWEAAKFYKHLGFTLAGKLPNHYLKRDFVLYSKEIKN